MAACGGGDDKAKGTVNTANATMSINQVIAVNASMMTSDGASAASAVQQMTSAGQSIVTPSQSSPRTTGTSAATTGTAECTPTSCTFTNYGDDVAGWSIDGTITKSGDTTTFDLDYHVTSGGMPLDWTIDGSITLTATSLDGRVHSHGVTTLQGGSGSPGGDLTWDTKVDYESIVLTEGCATGGSIHAEVSYQYGAGSYAAQGDATFGPTCGTVTAE
jgi:hypothetical protein